MTPLFRRTPSRPASAASPAPPGGPGAAAAEPGAAGADPEAVGADAAQRARARRVTLIGKPGCHLCDDARRVVSDVCADLGVPWEERDITQDAELHRWYWEQIPVVLIDGEQHDFWRVDARRLRSALLR